MISIIAAVAQNGVIGGENKLLWHIPEDLRRFKAITSGHPVVMGRKTFESLGRPLPNRTNIVVTRNRGYSAEGISTAGSLEEALAMLPSGEEVFVIGGGEIYRQALPIADRLYITEVLHDYEGDTTFLAVDPAQWQEESSEYHPHGEKYPYPFRCVNYRRRE
ncbi:MAG: dihydrofolate reductase [Alistipes sp.]|nr:dihydrofolate reductase [Alistipes sp.]